jgi:O-antigen ligase
MQMKSHESSKAEKFELNKISPFDWLVGIYLVLMIFLNHTRFVYIPNLAFIALIVCFGTRLLMGLEAIRISRVVALFGLILLGSFLPVLTGRAASMELAQSHVIRSFQLLALIIVISSYITNNFRLQLALAAITIGYLLAFLVGFVVLRLNAQGRYIGLYSNPNMTGFWSINTIIVCGLLINFRSLFVNPRRWIVYVTLIISSAILLIVLSQSRKSLVALGLILLFYLLKQLFLSRHRLIFLSLVFLSFSSIGVFIAAYPNNPVVVRFVNIMPQSTGVASEDQSVVDRLEFYKAGWRMIVSNPIIGYGGDAFPAIGNQFSTTFRQGRDLHSAILNTYVESGVIGFSSYLILYIGLILFVLRRLNDHPVFPFILLSLGLLIVIQLGESLYLDKFMWILLVIFSFIKDSPSSRLMPVRIPISDLPLAQSRLTVHDS